MEQSLTQSLLKPKSVIHQVLTRKSSLIRPDNKPNRLSYQQINKRSLHEEDLQWQKSSQQYTVEIQKSIVQIKPKKSDKLIDYERSKIQTDKTNKTLNDKVFGLNSSVQFKLYWFNLIMNCFMRILFINLLVFLYLQDKIQYLYIFMSLELIAILLYFIAMIKMLFTKSTKESVYFQKIFNDKEWADIQEERVMRRHFGFFKILSKVKEFFNPFTKFDQDKKISFLCQQIFKRMELVLVYAPFSVMYFLNNNDFVTPSFPYFNLGITSAICLEILRTTIQYLLLYIFN